MLSFLHHTTFHKIIKIQHLLTPIAIDWCTLAQNPGLQPREYKTLYIFGIRVGTWRVDQ